jgi:hypothetical protein
MIVRRCCKLAQCFWNSRAVSADTPQCEQDSGTPEPFLPLFPSFFFRFLFPFEFLLPSEEEDVGEDEAEEEIESTLLLLLLFVVAPLLGWSAMLLPLWPLRQRSGWRRGKDHQKEVNRRTGNAGNKLKVTHSLYVFKARMCII